jgi:hypothetical protein
VKSHFEMLVEAVGLLRAAEKELDSVAGQALPEQPSEELREFMIEIQEGD